MHAGSGLQRCRALRGIAPGRGFLLGCGASAIEENIVTRQYRERGAAYRRIAAWAAPLALGLAVCGCTINNDVQQIAVQTVPAGADCAVHRGGALLARIAPTPGTVTLGKTTEPITFVCSKPGFETARYVNRPAAQASGTADRIAVLLGQSSDAASVLYASPVTITLAQSPPPKPKRPAHIPYGTLQPAPAPVPTPPVESTPIAGSVQR
jgi:hypothetical protein